MQRIKRNGERKELKKHKTRRIKRNGEQKQYHKKKQHMAWQTENSTMYFSLASSLSFLKTVVPIRPDGTADWTAGTPSTSVAEYELVYGHKATYRSSEQQVQSSQTFCKNIS
jgi:hypothetical protein